MRLRSVLYSSCDPSGGREGLHVEGRLAGLRGGNKQQGGEFQVSALATTPRFPNLQSGCLAVLGVKLREQSEGGEVMTGPGELCLTRCC